VASAAALQRKAGPMPFLKHNCFCAKKAFEFPKHLPLIFPILGIKSKLGIA
jgi:hypothetical protein